MKSNPKCLIELATCNAEKKSVNDKFAKSEKDCVMCQNDRERLRDEHKIELDKCLNDLKNSETKESKELVKLATCQAASKAKENYELKGLDSKCNERILNLVTDNATCHTEKNSVNEKFAKCEEDRVSCQKDRERLREDKEILSEGYVRYEERHKAQIENEMNRKSIFLCCLRNVKKILRYVKKIKINMKRNANNMHFI